MNSINREKAVETCLIIASGFLFVYFISQLKVFLYVSFVVGIIGSFIKPLAILISWLWIKLGDGMGYVVSKIVLSIIFFLFLLPLALIYRAIQKDSLGIKKDKNSYWKNRDHKYLPGDLENTW